MRSLLFCGAFPALGLAAFYGVCVAAYQAERVKGKRRLMLYVIALSPSVTVAMGLTALLMRLD